jgi:TPR repeat protein
MLRAWFAAAMSLSSCLCMAVPSDDHARGVLAYQRGDVVEAMSALRVPARAGYAPSQALLAFILDRADFSDEAFTLYRDAAAQNDAEGHAGLASLYLAGRGVAKDEKLARQHFSKAAELGHAASIETLANAFLKRQLGLDADGPDAGAAVAALTRAAGQDHAASAEALARAYQSGRYGLAADPVQAASWQARAEAIRKKQSAPVAKVSK